MEEAKKPRLENFLTEETMLEVLGIKKEQLNYLRNDKHFPFVRVGGTRMYYEQDVVDWLLENRGREQ